MTVYTCAKSLDSHEQLLLSQYASMHNVPQVNLKWLKLVIFAVATENEDMHTVRSLGQASD